MPVKKLMTAVFAVWFVFLYGFQPVSAAGQTAAGTVAVAQAQDIHSSIKFTNIRSSQSTEKTRIVFDFSDDPEYTVDVQGDIKRLTITLKNTELSGVLSVFAFKDNLVKQVTTVSGTDNDVKIVIDLAYIPRYEIFRLKNPHRLVIDLAKIFEEKTEQQLTDGLSYTIIRAETFNGPLSIRVLDYDLKSPRVKLEHVLADDAIPGTETVKSMAVRKNALAAVNGTFFSTTGELLGLIIQDDQIIQSPINNRSAFALTNNGEILMDQVSYTGAVVLPDGSEHPIDAVNRERGPDELVIYTPAYGVTTQSNKYGTEYAVADGKVSQISDGNSLIPANGVVISVHGSSEKALASLKVGDTVLLKQQLTPGWANLHLAVGAGPGLVRDGMIYLTTKTEGFGSDVAGGRAPRTAVGVNAQGHLLIVAVDGRQPGYSIGMTLMELAKFMRDLGAINAINLDGGGSTQMIISGEVANRPSDGKERPVGDALVFVPVN